MKLDAELIDVARDLSPLRFVLFQLMLDIGNSDGVVRRGGKGRIRNCGWFPALLAVQSHARGGGIDDQRGGAKRAGKNDI